MPPLLEEETSGSIAALRPRTQQEQDDSADSLDTISSGSYPKTDVLQYYSESGMEKVTTSSPPSPQQQQQQNDSSADPQSVVSPSEEKRNVHFYPQVLIRKIPGRSFYTEKDIQRMWLRREDYERIRCQQEAEEMNAISFFKQQHNEQPSNEEEFTQNDKDNGISKDTSRTSRNVENKLTMLIRIRQHVAYRENQLKALDAVMDEQDAQDREGYYCDVSIATVYLKYTEIAKLRARKSAIRHAKLVESYYNEELLSAAALADHYNID